MLNPPGHYLALPRAPGTDCTPMGLGTVCNRGHRAVLGGVWLDRSSTACVVEEVQVVVLSSVVQVIPKRPQSTSIACGRVDRECEQYRSTMQPIKSAAIVVRFFPGSPTSRCAYRNTSKCVLNGCSPREIRRTFPTMAGSIQIE